MRVAFGSVVQSQDDVSGFLVLGGQGFSDSVFFLLDSVLEFDASDYEWKEWGDRLPWGGRSWMRAVPLTEGWGGECQ